MTQTSYPFDSINTTEAQYSQLFRRLQQTGVAGDPNSTDLKVTADSSGMNVKIAAGYAVVRGHFYKSDAVETITIAAASTNPRRDLIVLRLDPAANSIVLAVKQGTAAASPSDPSVSQTDEGTFELVLARITVPANATTISASDVTDLRVYTGDQFGRWTTALRPTSPRIGQPGFNVSTGYPELWDGSAWVEFQQSTILANKISAAEQAKIVAGSIRSGGSAAGAAIRVFVQSTQPTGAASGDLWFW